MAKATILKPQIIWNHLDPHPWLRRRPTIIAYARNTVTSRTIVPHRRPSLIPLRLCLPLLLRFRELPLSSPMSTDAAASASPPSSDITTIRAVIKGRVQGVFYRDWTVENAKELGLKGWVRNRRDGMVEALFSGSREKVLEMKERCRRGPPDAAVTGIDVLSPRSDDPAGVGEFERRPTV
ncbi:unnamed protein product [Cuscuta campestris]|uniref:acylphosphatase n=1 Tax=Cuscuta campestris TaxID=132261 RepID=A0A484LR14_9ASTE|nr:unnamed protein product [Cuscuta campestris]